MKRVLLLIIFGFISNVFSATCPDYHQVDCNGECYHNSIFLHYQNNESCEMGKSFVAPNLNCAELNYDNGACIFNEDGAGCPADYVSDCSGDGDCCPREWIGDEYQDCGNQSWGCDLTCYGNDGEDCGPFVCDDSNLIPDCDYNCVPSILSTDNTCHDTNNGEGNFFCERLNYDNGACGYPDCYGNLYDYDIRQLVGDGNCDNGRDGSVNLSCPYYDFDASDCLRAPDLLVDEDALRDGLYLDNVNNNDPCYVEEQCFSGEGVRLVLRFDTMIANIGNEDFIVGEPGDGNPAWTYSECHNHWHMDEYAYYRLFELPCMEDLEIGHKNGWCVMDLTDYPGDGISCDYTYGCSNQGIASGCADIYGDYIDCQWLDITDVPDGEYVLQVSTNEGQTFTELNYDNNYAQVGVRIENYELDILSNSELQEILSTCETSLQGDLDGDGLVNVVDVVLMVNFILGAAEYDNTQFQSADFNSDGSLDVTDVILLINLIIND